MHIGIIYIVCGLFIGFLGRKLRFGFWGFFFATMLFTPLVSFIMYLASAGSPSEKNNAERCES